MIASQLGGEWSHAPHDLLPAWGNPHSPEEIADEMLAILQMRERYVEQKISEHANASITAFYNREREDEEQDELVAR